jgi:cytochrome c553
MPALSAAWVLLTYVYILAGSSAARAGEFTAADFENKIRPVLIDTCFRCHGDTKTSGALRVDSRDALLQGGESGPAVIPGNPDTSLLMKAVRRQDDASAMPPDNDKALRADQIAAFENWIRSGAPWPAQSAKFEGAQHWAFAPVREHPVPLVQDQTWCRNDIDRFIRAKQEATGVSPSPAAGRLTLIRRITFDLTGLPPTPDEVRAYEQDPSPAATETLIDRLLDSPHYGERWGRHWLDVVRYADTAGETADYPVPLAWRYRNYVIQSFNADKPYDQFLREQIAGDVLAAAGPKERYAEQVTATGYLAISRRFGFDSENYHHLTIQDTIDTLGQSVLGLSLGCARCHDHKFDDISMQDYYALYGIFDSSRYAFPGSEQKQKFRAMVPLLPPDQAVPKWREFDRRVGAIMVSLEKQSQAVPSAILRSLNDIDGDFEMQAPAAGGSNGVLVPPWLYEGRIAVTNAAQSPFRNLYGRGKVGASISAGSEPWQISQSLYPQRTAENCRLLYVNLDFRVAAADASAPGAHQFFLGDQSGNAAIRVLVSATTVSLRSDRGEEQIAAIQPGQWHNLQLTINLAQRTISGSVGVPGAITPFAERPLCSDWSGSIDMATLQSWQADKQNPVVVPGIEFDHLGVQESPIPEVSTDLPDTASVSHEADMATLSAELQQLTGSDSDFELQTAEAPPAAPWNTGPNSVVKLAQRAQSPFQNLFPAGELGVYMPNRGEYDGFGVALPTSWNATSTSELHASFDFRCSDTSAGADGSWRYYLGHGPGNSPAVELFFNGKEFFRRSGNARETVCGLNPKDWYQVRLILDLHNRSYTGVLISRSVQTPFSGQMANGWDGTIDYSFIDSYGHLGGIRPSLDADNYVVQTAALPAFDNAAMAVDHQQSIQRRQRVRQIRNQMAEIRDKTQKATEELRQLLTDGPFAMTYGMAEGTPHDVRIQLRGEPDHPGDIVSRGFISALGGTPLPRDAAGSGRLELAQWLTDPANPLTARVMVNRIWQYHFGRGLVKTANDFGVRGIPATHPELLDSLATEFIRSGWSIKAMHRLILSSSTWQQSSDRTLAAVDPSMTSDVRDLYASFERRRLSAEEIRDSILMVSGNLETTPAEGHPFPSPISWGFSQHGPFHAVYDHNHRSVYLMTQRLRRHPFLALFDGPDPNASTADRLGTTVPTQALYFLNDPFVHMKATAWAAQLSADTHDTTAKIHSAYRTAFGRTASDQELQDALQFMATCRSELTAIGQPDPEKSALAAFLRTLLGCNEFLHVD